MAFLSLVLLPHEVLVLAAFAVFSVAALRDARWDPFPFGEGLGASPGLQRGSHVRVSKTPDHNNDWGSSPEKWPAVPDKLGTNQPTYSEAKPL